MPAGIIPYNEHILPMEGRIIEFTGNLENFEFSVPKNI